MSSESATRTKTPWRISARRNQVNVNTIHLSSRNTLGERYLICHLDLLSDLWLSYIDFKQKFGNNKSPDAISNIYWKAMKQLDESLADEFSQKFCLIKNDPSILGQKGDALEVD